jgi:TonB family protein
MVRRIALVSPLVLVLGCGAPAAPAEAPPQSPAASAAPAAEPAVAPAPSAAAASSPPPGETKSVGRATAQDAGKAPSSGAATDAPIMTGLTPEQIFDGVQKSSNLFNGCYSLGAGKSKDFRATVKVKATVGPTGAVNAAEVLTSNAKNAKVDACVLEAFKKIKFPPPKGGGTAVITFPMNFDGSQQVQ